jgi:hypothetical protein
MKAFTAIVAALAFLLVSCSGPRKVVIRTDRSNCMRVERIPGDVELIVIDCTTKTDTILVIKQAQ